MKTARTLAFALLPLALGCDLALFPEQADYAGGDSVRASVDVSADAMTDRDDLTEVEVEVVDLMIHKPEDDSWVLLGAQTIRVNLINTPRAADLPRVPVRPREYDKIAFGVASVRIETGDRVYEAALESTEVELEGDFTVAGDVIVHLNFDLDASIIGDAATGFLFAPVADARLLD